MKFYTLLKKELRESLLPMILVMLAFTGITAFMIRAFIHDGANDYPNYEYQNIQRWYELFHDYPIEGVGFLLLYASLLLGLGLGGLHFGLPLLTKTWAFLMHRSVSRSSILGSKLLVAFIAFGLALGIPWSWAYLYVDQVKATGFPTDTRIIWEGWLFIGLGLTVYLGSGLCAMSTTRWYTTRLFGLGFVTLLFLAIFSQWNLVVAYILLLIGITILLVQLVSTFLQREF